MAKKKERVKIVVVISLVPCVLKKLTEKEREESDKIKVLWHISAVPP